MYFRSKSNVQIDQYFDSKYYLTLIVYKFKISITHENIKSNKLIFNENKSNIIFLTKPKIKSKNAKIQTIINKTKKIIIIPISLKITTHRSLTNKLLKFQIIDIIINKITIMLSVTNKII
jgi:hypothetical protein